MHNEKKKEIRKNTYMTIPYGASKQLDMLPGVMRLLAGPIGSLLETLKGLDGLSASTEVATVLEGVRGAAVQEGLIALADQLESGGRDLIFDLLGNTYRMKGRKQSDGLESCTDEFDTVFQGDFLSLVLVLAWVLKENYFGRLVTAGYGSWTEVTQEMSLAECVRAHQHLDVQAEAERIAYRANKPKRSQ